jgi:hypothetical protein
MRAKENNLDRIILPNNALCHDLDAIGRRHLTTSKHTRRQTPETSWRDHPDNGIYLE